MFLCAKQESFEIQLLLAAADGFLRPGLCCSITVLGLGFAVQVLRGFFLFLTHKMVSGREGVERLSCLSLFDFSRGKGTVTAL